MGFLSSYNGQFREALLWPLGKSSLLSSCEVGRSIALESRQGNQTSRHIEGEILKSLRIGAGNPGFPRLVMVTSGSFSWCLWEVRNTLELEAPLGIPLRSMQWKRASSRVEGRISGFLSCSDVGLRVC